MFEYSRKRSTRRVPRSDRISGRGIGPFIPANTCFHDERENRLGTVLGKITAIRRDSKLKSPTPDEDDGFIDYAKGTTTRMEDFTM